MAARSSQAREQASKLDRLADVELQLLLQPLDNLSRVNAARCCKRLLAAAQQPLSWQHAEAYSVRSDELPIAALQPAAPGLAALQLLRRVPLSIRMSSKAAALQHAHLAGILNLGELDSSELCPHPWAPWAALFTEPPVAPALQTLRSVRFGTEIHLTPGFILTLRALAQLPQLTRLSLVVPDMPRDLAVLEPLAQAPCLTDLSVRTMRRFGFPCGYPCLPALLQTRGLRRLRLDSVSFDQRDVWSDIEWDGAEAAGSTFTAFFTSPAMAQLEVLSFCGLSASYPGDDAARLAERYRPVFAALRQLRRLELESTTGVDDLLPHVSNAPALSELLVECAFMNASTLRDLGPCIPTAGVLSALLTAVPSLRVTLRSPVEDKWLRTHEYEEAERQLSQLRALLELPRVSREECDP